MFSIRALYKLILCLLLFLVYVNGTSLKEESYTRIKEPVKLTIFIETLCPDSIKFVVNQLLPTWNALQGMISIDLNAYGNAKDSGIATGYGFTCQHGPEECFGNMVLECAKRYVNDVNSFLQFVACFMFGIQPHHQRGEACGQNCWREMGANTRVWSHHQRGQQLLHNAGIYQKSFHPISNSVPWIIINNSFTHQHLKDAQVNLFELLCSIYAQNGVRISECTKYGYKYTV
ncbi:hypothetical protein SK128_005402 [Halocaridina rubra]|uniref:Gamma-interferon-inducible lysosomal thiol reductase n=1 Tax=Halocaridina rubra TaxID=373956 RepID=A0AAN8XDT0_HALRR